MRISRLYLSQNLILNQKIMVMHSASHYIKNVLRLKPGDSLIIFDGKGKEYQGCVDCIRNKSVYIIVDRLIEKDIESPLWTHLGQCISRGDRMDYAIQKATELGVSEITPLFSERCEIKLDENRQKKRLQHWRNISISACEQSGRNAIVKINNPILVSQWVNSVKSEVKILMHTQHNNSLKNFPNKSRAVSLLIGSEGGLTESEVEFSLKKGFVPITIGQRILRTETAPVVALTLLQYFWGDLNV